MSEQPPSPTERPSKKARLMEADGNQSPVHTTSTVSPIAQLEDGLLRKIAGFLHFTDLNELACVSNKWQLIRNSPSLDQTREIQLTFATKSSRPIAYHEAANHLDGMRQQVAKHPQFTKLLVQNFPPRISLPRGYSPIPWQHITDLSVTRVSSDRINLRFFLTNFPNLRKLHLEGLSKSFASYLFRNLPSANNLMALQLGMTGEGFSRQLPTVDMGGSFFRGLPALRRLHIDGMVVSRAFFSQEIQFLRHLVDRIEDVSCVGAQLDMPGEP